MMQIKIILTDQATMTITRILRRGTTAAKTINKNVLKRQKANNGFVFNTNSYGNTKNTWSYFQSFQNSGRSNIRLQSKNLYLHEIEYMRNEKENRNSEDNNKKVGDEDEYASFKLLSGSLACLGLANLLRTSTKAESDNNKKSYECVNVLPEDPEQIEDDVLTNNEILLLMREMEKQKQDMERQYKNMQEQFEKLKGVVDRKVGEEETSCSNNDKVLESENVERGDKIITLLSYLAKMAGVISIIYIILSYIYIKCSLMILIY